MTIEKRKIKFSAFRTRIYLSKTRIVSIKTPRGWRWHLIANFFARNSISRQRRIFSPSSSFEPLISIQCLATLDLVLCWALDQLFVKFNLLKTLQHRNKRSTDKYHQTHFCYFKRHLVWSYQQWFVNRCKQFAIRFGCVTQAKSRYSR